MNENSVAHVSQICVFIILFGAIFREWIKGLGTSVDCVLICVGMEMFTVLASVKGVKLLCKGI